MSMASMVLLQGVDKFPGCRAGDLGSGGLWLQPSGRLAVDRRVMLWGVKLGQLWGCGFMGVSFTCIVYYIYIYIHSE